MDSVHGRDGFASTAISLLPLVDPINLPEKPRLSGYFHFFGLKGALLLQLGRAREARAAFDRAIALANTAAEAAHIRLHLDRLIKNNAPSDDDTRASS